MCGCQTVIIDEAAQAVEPSALIPVGRAPRCVLIGDPNQLAATVMSSPQNGAAAYQRSFFERLQLSKVPCSFLSTQYRMHPEISAFPSHTFYNGATNLHGAAYLTPHCCGKPCLL